MDLTPVQQRTLEQLIGVETFPEFDPGLEGRLRASIEEAARDAGVASGAAGAQLWLSKERLNDAERCDGLLEASVSGERAPFAHTGRSAAGALAHRAIEGEVSASREHDPWDLVLRAEMRLADDEGFSGFWSGLDDLGRDEIRAEAVRCVDLFRGSFPPLRKGWCPVSEQRQRVELLGGALVLSGRADLVLGQQDPARPLTGCRIAFDLKSGRARPEHAEDMRFYALLMTLRFGVPPYRVATFFLESGTWQAEDVTVLTLQRAVHRVAAAVSVIARLGGGGRPDLRPGPYCSWCPRRQVCPAITQVA